MSPAPKPRKTGMARLLQLALTKKALVLCSCLFAVLSAGASFVPFLAVYMIIREVAASPDLSALDSAVLARYGWIAAGGGAAAVFLNFVALFFSHLAAFSSLYKLKLDFASRLASLSLGFHAQNPTGRLRKIADDNIEKLELFIAHQLPDLAGSLATPVLTLALLLFLDWRLGLGSIVPVAAAYWFQASAFASRDAKIDLREYQDSLEDMNAAAVEYVRGISVVKAFNQTIFSFKKFHYSIVNYGAFVKEYSASHETRMALFVVVINHVYLFVLPVVIILASGAADYGRFAVSSVFYLFFSLYVPTPFTKLLYASRLGSQIADGIARMDRILDLEPLPPPKSPREAEGYSVSFEGVSFAYGEPSPDPFEETAGAPWEGAPGADEGICERPGLALRDVSFVAEEGKITALAGPSGCGKSTAAHLIPRFYDVKEGRVAIGGADVRDMLPEYLMGIVGFVFQDVFLFKKSVMENIRAGNLKASDEEARRAAELAQCAEFIEALPRGYDTVVGRDGAHLSAGQRQRLVIARAILKNAPILVLDEATSFSDAENERKIQEALGELIKDKTVVVIAHRLSTIRNADKIVVLDRGAKIEEGTHGELLLKNGRYARMWEAYGKACGSLGAEAPSEKGQNAEKGPVAEKGAPEEKAAGPGEARVKDAVTAGGEAAGEEKKEAEGDAS